MRFGGADVEKPANGSSAQLSRIDHFIDLLNSGGADRIDAYLYRWCNSSSRPREFLEVFRELGADGPTFWRCVSRLWAGFDAIPHREFADWFRYYRGSRSADAMQPDDRVWFDRLAPRLTIYRGQSARNACGLSWTLNRDVAIGFARGHRGIAVPEPVLLTARIRKSAIAFVCTDRKEDEVVLLQPLRRYQIRPVQDELRRTCPPDGG